MGTRALGWESDRLVTSSGILDELAAAIGAELYERGRPTSLGERELWAEGIMRRLLDRLGA